MPKMVCVPCRLFFKIKKGGVCIEEGRPLGDGAWGPYKLWMGDVWECKGCGAQVVAGFGMNPVSEHYMAEYGQERERHRPVFRVDDC